MAAYVIGHIRIKDPANWAAYRGQVPGTLAPWEGQVLLRGRRVAVLSGEHSFTDTVVLQFPDIAAAQAWHASPAYQALIPLRTEAADVLLISYEA
jgi:uncharacterized protein (DUF1330 family)